jgi:hypothetical protein
MAGHSNAELAIRGGGKGFRFRSSSFLLLFIGERVTTIHTGKGHEKWRTGIHWGTGTLSHHDSVTRGRTQMLRSSDLSEHAENAEPEPIGCWWMVSVVVSIRNRRRTKMLRIHDGTIHQQRFSEVLDTRCLGVLDTRPLALARQPLSGEVHSATIGYSPTSLRFRPGGETLGYDRQVAEGVDVRKGLPGQAGAAGRWWGSDCLSAPASPSGFCGSVPLHTQRRRWVGSKAPDVVTIQKNAGRPMGEPSKQARLV